MLNQFKYPKIIISSLMLALLSIFIIYSIIYYQVIFLNLTLLMQTFHYLLFSLMNLIIKFDFSYA